MEPSQILNVVVRGNNWFSQIIMRKMSNSFWREILVQYIYIYIYIFFFKKILRGYS